MNNVTVSHRLTHPAWAAIVLTVIAACAAGQELRGSKAVHDVYIEDGVEPRQLYVQRGDEIRWHNRRANEVKLGLIGTQWRNHLACEKGFTRFGMTEDLVTIRPQAYVSLCFATPGTIRYNVWLDPKNLTGSMTPTSTIRVD